MKPIKRDEAAHLCETIRLVKDNITLYEEAEQLQKKQWEQLTDRMTPRDREMNSQLAQSLAISKSMLDHVRGQLKKNHQALSKPYFGRIDFEEENGSRMSLYIGKNGISEARIKEEAPDPIVVDWRAPVAKVYYENEMGSGTYEVPEYDPVAIDLVLKRTFDIDQGVLSGFYDSDVAANDELLVKYLAKHKDVVLGDIIATIQKEQDRIIREEPYHNTIVQGVAGSGKTTVALHKISHILYNYAHRYHSEDFCIIGSSDMLLSYITSGLPDLDVENVSQRRMDVFFEELLEGGLRKGDRVVPAEESGAFKCRLSFIRAFDRYLSKSWYKLLKPHSIEDEIVGTILSRSQMYDLLNYRRDWSIKRIETMLNETLKKRIDLLIEVDKEDPEYLKKRKLRSEKKQEYRKYFRFPAQWYDIRGVYKTFLFEYGQENGIDTVDALKRLDQNRLDVYDLAALALAEMYLTRKELPESYGQIIIDEAQDFGEMIYFALKKLQPGCFFTIMGDVSQNIHYEMGMNEWEPLVKEVFNDRKDEFLVLSKSYRNTIEISSFAGKVLDRIHGSRYKIDPVIRHGDPVDVRVVVKHTRTREAVNTIRRAKENGYRSVAVICRTAKEAAKVEERLQAAAPELCNEKDLKVMVLPIELVKGLEFDTVILWEASETNYPADIKNAKLLYVAITRALHELHIWAGDKITTLLN